MDCRPANGSILLMRSPYEAYQPAPRDWKPLSVPPKGAAIVWNLGTAENVADDYEYVRNRPFGVPLFVILPEPKGIHAILPIISALPALRTRALLPIGRLTSISALRKLLADSPRHLSTTVVKYLTWRGLVPSALYSDIATLFACARDARSVSKLAQRLYVSRRTLGRRFAERGVPVPSHWLQFARLIHAVVLLQATPIQVARTATQLGYPDGFTLSNQMRRLFGVRPTVVRQHLGWEWVVESWIRCEVERNGFDVERYGPQTLPYRRDGDARRGVR